MSDDLDPRNFIEVELDRVSQENVHRRAYPMERPLSDAERMAVAEALTVSPDHQALGWVEWSGRVFLNFQPIRSRVLNRQLRTLRQAMRDMERALLVLHRDVYLRIDARLWEATGGTIDDLGATISHLRKASQRLGGRPREWQQEWLILHLARIWQEVHGDWPRRSGGDPEERWPFLVFVESVGKIYAPEDPDCPWPRVLRRVTAHKSYPLQEHFQRANLRRFFPNNVH